MVNVFYNVWGKVEESNVKNLKRHKLLKHVQKVIDETIRRMNEEIPRLNLKGVTSADVLRGNAEERRERNRLYLENEQKKEVIEPWNRKDWGFVRKHFFKETISNHELMTKFCFFLKQPLRKLAKLGGEVLGN